jgi:DNA-directed RNA polymerase subunit RPC12/RpoP
MPVILLRLSDLDHLEKKRPRKCPYCGSVILQRWGRVVRDVRDTQNRLVEAYRYRCGKCERTFRDYPSEIDQTGQTSRIRHLAALACALGLSCREVSAFLNKKGIDLSHVTVWRDSQEVLARIKEQQETLRKYSIDTVFLRDISSKLGIVVAVDLGDGNSEILGTIDEHNPRILKSWLEPLVENVEIEVLELGTGELRWMES